MPGIDTAQAVAYMPRNGGPLLSGVNECNSPPAPSHMATLQRAIEEAYVSIADEVVRTPVVRLPWLDSPRRTVWAKLESQQHSGSFKYRGALYALRRCTAPRIITASAGNHALATAAVGVKLGKQVEVIAPATASEIKITRLARDVRVTVIGRDLYEATQVARARAEASRHDGSSTPLHYLSPYADIDVAAGAGTMMREACAQLDAAPDIVVTPLGGGGLAAAVGAFCRGSCPSTRLICTHPLIFGRCFTSPHAGVSTQLLRPTEPTLSDGLGVQLVEPTPFADVLDETVSQVVQVSEDQTSAAIAALLRMQSLLVEGAAATTVAALLADPDGVVFNGNVLLLLTGGNIMAAAVAKALVADVASPDLRQRLGLRHILDPVERHGGLNGHHNTVIPGLNKHISLSLVQIWAFQAADLTKSITELREMAARKSVLDRRLCLDEDPWCNQVFQNLDALVVRLLAEYSSELADSSGTALLSSWQMEDRYRVLLNLRSVLGSVFHRASAAYDQSRRSWYFDTSCQNATAVNYDRYGSSTLRSLELRLLDTLRLGRSEPIDLLLTSSGMSAFQIIFLYLVQTLRPKDVVVTSPYIYFEALEQLEALPHIQIIRAPDYSHGTIIATAEKYQAKAVLLDAVANIVDMPTTDIRQFLQQVSGRDGWSDRTVVIDGTMTSGALQVFDWVQSAHRPTVLYYESMSKYLQLGLDVQMAGLLAYSTRLDETMRTIRRNSGTILYLRAAMLMPSLTYDVFQSRMRLLTDHAKEFECNVRDALSMVAEVRYPREWRDYGWRHGGTLCTIRFYDNGMNNKEGLEACIDLVLRSAEKLQVPFTKGVSFGFSTARISAASSMARDSDPFLRVNVGLPDPMVSATAADAVIAGIRDYVAGFV